MSSQRQRRIQDARMSVLQQQNYMLSELSEQLQDSNHQKDEYIGQLEQKLLYLRTDNMDGNTKEAASSRMIIDTVEELQRQVTSLQTQLSQTDANVAAIPLARVEVLETMVEHQASQIQTLQQENSQLWEHLNDVDILSTRESSPPQKELRCCDSSSRASHVYRDAMEYLGSESMEFLSSKDHLEASLRSELGTSRSGRHQRRRTARHHHRHEYDDQRSCHSAASTGNNAFFHDSGICSASSNVPSASCPIPPVLSPHYHSRSLMEKNDDFLIGYNRNDPNKKSPPINAPGTRHSLPGTEPYAVDSLLGDSFDELSDREGHMSSLRCGRQGRELSSRVPLGNFSEPREVARKSFTKFPQEVQLQAQSSKRPTTDSDCTINTEAMSSDSLTNDHFESNSNFSQETPTPEKARTSSLKTKQQDQQISKNATDQEEFVEEAKEALQTLVAFLDKNIVSSKSKESLSRQESNQSEPGEEFVAIIEDSSIPAEPRRNASWDLFLGQLPWNGKKSDAKLAPPQQDEATERSNEHTSSSYSPMVENVEDDDSTCFSMTQSSVKSTKLARKGSNKKSTISAQNTLLQWKSSPCAMSRSPWVSAGTSVSLIVAIVAIAFGVAAVAETSYCAKQELNRIPKSAKELRLLN